MKIRIFHRLYMQKLGAAVLAAALLMGTLTSCGNSRAGESSAAGQSSAAEESSAAGESSSGQESSMPGESTVPEESSSPDGSSVPGENGTGSEPDSSQPTDNTTPPVTEPGSWTDRYQAPTAESLLSTGSKQNRYMTLPDSRVVVNPFNFESQSRETTQVQYSNRPTMPINFGFCDPFKGESRGVELANVVMMAEGRGTGGSVQNLWEANLNSQSDWSFSGTEGVDYTASIGGGKGTIGVCAGASIAWQHAQAPVTVDVTNAYLTVTIESLSRGDGRFAVKLTDGGPVDILLTESNVPGTYSFKLSDFTSWSGTKSFAVKIFSITQGNVVTFSNLKIQSGQQVYSDAASYTTSWRPDQLGFSASYADGAKVTGKDFFYDEKTVVRDMTLTGSKGFLIYGEYNGDASVSGNTILVDCGNFKYAVTVSANVKPRFYSSVVEAKAGGAGSSAPAADYGVWAYQVESIPAGGRLRVSVAFDTKAVSDASVISLSQKPGSDCDQRLAQRTAQWNDLLSRVPRPGNFTLTGIDAKGVTAADVKQSYYEAWVQVIGNVLPASPEIGYNYRSFATGKASLWGYGSPKCSYSATWEALYGMSYYAQIDADQAWEMYRGLMSLVEPSGMIAGESLPSNNARVAWMLYTVKPDKQALAEIQAGLTRHLQWRFENPRWIYGDYTTDTQQKDMDFVSAALIDVRYLMRINEELGLESQNAQWETKIRDLYSNMKTWFFSPLTTYPVQYFSYNGNVRSDGNALWVTKALHVPDLQSSEASALLRLFRTRYNANLPFCGMGGIKYEPYNYTLLGLMEHGYVTEARTMSQAAVRDIVLSGIHSEGYNYTGTETEPLPEGVRPSMFGAAMMIDNVWLMNGVRMDDGMPVFANYFDQDGGVENFTVAGKTFSMKKEGNTFACGGTYMEGVLTMQVASGQVGLPFAQTNVHPLHG